MKVVFFILALVGLSQLSLTASASTHPPAPNSPSARAFHQAQRVAKMENSQDLPSRAFLLGTKVAQNSRMLDLGTKREFRPGKRKISSAVN